jgi:hypothetical protein
MIAHGVFGLGVSEGVGRDFGSTLTVPELIPVYPPLWLVLLIFVLLMGVVVGAGVGVSNGALDCLSNSLEGASATRFISWSENQNPNAHKAAVMVIMIAHTKAVRWLKNQVIAIAEVETTPTTSQTRS